MRRASSAEKHVPIVTAMEVPIAEHDSMQLNLSGAHASLCIRNLLILSDSDGNTGVGEAPGGEAIRRTLEPARPLAVGSDLGSYHGVCDDAPAMQYVFPGATVDSKRPALQRSGS